MHCARSGTSTPLTAHCEQSGDGVEFGIECVDTVVIGSVGDPDQAFGVGGFLPGFEGADCILGWVPVSVWCP